MIDDSASFFTKQERLERYRAVLERFSSNNLAGFGKPEWRLIEDNASYYLYHPTVYWLDEYTDELRDELSFLSSDFPEFYAQKPECDPRGYRMNHFTYQWSKWWYHRDDTYSCVIKWLQESIKLCL